MPHTTETNSVRGKSGESCQPPYVYDPIGSGGGIEPPTHNALDCT